MVLSKATLYRPLMPEQMIVFHQPSWIIQAASSQAHPQHWGLFWGIRVIKGNSRDESHLRAGCTHYSSEATLSWSKSDSAEAPSFHLLLSSPPSAPFWWCWSFRDSLGKLRNVIDALGQVEGKWWEECSTSKAAFLFFPSFFPVALSKLIYFTSSHAPLHAGSLQALEWTCLLAEIFWDLGNDKTGILKQ